MKKYMRAVEILYQDYEMRRVKNPRFSKRSYARILGVSSGRLTDILNQKSPLSEKMAATFATKLILSPEERDYFLHLVENEQQTRVDRRRKTSRLPIKKLSLKEYESLSDWEYFAFLALIETSTFKSDITWIARKLNVDIDRMTNVIRSLQQLGFITIDSTGTIANVHKSLSTLNETSLTLPVNPAKLKDAQSLIREFKMKMVNLLVDQDTSEVYNLNIQLVPISTSGI